MKIIIGGGTGLVGRSLVKELLLSKHDIHVVGRDKNKINRIFNNSVTALTWDELSTIKPDEFDAIVNLAGENISDHRWSPKVKEKLLSSRIKSTEQFVLWAQKASKKPHLYNASAVGIYGLQKELPAKNATYSEESDTTEASKHCFSSELVNLWENAALRGTEFDIPVTVMRFAVVLKHGEGMLKKLELPAKLGMGAVVGTGNQPLAWIDHVDLIHAILFLIAHPEITGPVNLVAPALTSQKVFNQTLAKVLKRPSFLRLPEFAVRLLFGQMGEELLLPGQAVAPKRLLEQEFMFQYPTLLEALRNEF